tara:strand:+ start:496 stop:957 length:462 start_codon:yes stop_codon:yes gene_type:complete
MKKINIKNYKKTLSKFTTGITVVCSQTNDKIIGKTINSFNSLSLNPPLVLFSLGNYSTNFKVFYNSNYLSINILSSKQKDISNIFSQKNPDPKKIDFIYEKNIAFIKGCIAHLECKIIDKIKKGDHTIFICKVLKVDYNDKLKPIKYFNSRYC